MMREDFAVFILTHGRADNMVTYETIMKQGYTGNWYMIIDNEDEQADLYKQNFGSEHIIIFDKQKAYDSTDTMDTFNNHKAIVYARNESFRIAKELGLKYFLMLDDDYSLFQYRKEKNGRLRGYNITNLDEIFNAMIEFLEDSNACTVAFAQGGDFVGGVNGGNFKKGLLRKAMNTFFCRTNSPIKFKGTMNEDVVTYTTESSRGKLFFTFTPIDIVQLQTQSLTGGMTEVYKQGGTYLKTFYAVMSMPSAVKVSVMETTNKRIHHKVSWDNCAPKILNEKWRNTDRG